MNLEKLIESYYAPKKGNDLLIQLIESKMNEGFSSIQEIHPKHYGDERLLKLKTINISNKIGQVLQKEGEALNYDRQFINIISQQLKLLGVFGTAVNQSFEARIQAYQEFFDRGSPENVSDQKLYTVSNIMAICMVSEALYHLINDYDESTAGKLFEPLFAGLFEGTFIQADGGKTNYDVPDVKNIPVNNTDPNDVREVSLKLIGVTSDITQSFANMLNYLLINPAGKEKGILYVVAFKESKSRISFYKFEINKDNWIDTISNINSFFIADEITYLKNIKDPLIRIEKAKELYSNRSDAIKNLNSRIKQEETILNGKRDFLINIGFRIKDKLRPVYLIKNKEYYLIPFKESLKKYEEYLKSNSKKAYFQEVRFKEERQIIEDLNKILSTQTYDANEKNYISLGDTRPAADYLIRFLKNFTEDYNRRLEIVKEGALSRETFSLELPSKQEKMAITANSIKIEKNFIGEMSCNPNRLEYILRGYTEIINQKMIEIYDNLKIYNNVIDDFFIKAEKRQDKQELMNQSVESAKTIETNLRSLVEEAPE